MTLPSTAVETAVARCTSRCAMARGHRLNTSIVLAAVHGLSGLFRAVSAVEPSLFRDGLLGTGTGDDDDELMLNVLRCHLTY